MALLPPNRAAGRECLQHLINNNPSVKLCFYPSCPGIYRIQNILFSVSVLDITPLLCLLLNPLGVFTQEPNVRALMNKTFLYQNSVKLFQLKQLSFIMSLF